MIKVDDYYFILPKSELILRKKSKISPVLNRFLLPMLLRSKDIESFGLGQENLNSIIKVIFLDLLKRTYYLENEKELFRSIFFDFKKTENYFDNLWSIYAKKIDDDIEDMLDDMIIFKTIFDIKNTGNDSVDLWFKRYIENIQND